MTGDGMGEDTPAMRRTATRTHLGVTLIEEAHKGEAA